MTRGAAIGIGLVTSVLGFVLGYWVGFGEGGRVLLSVELVPRAAISLHQINALRAGKSGNTLVGLESDIDNALLWTHDLQGDPLRPIYEWVWGIPPSKNDEYLTRLANHRKSNPSPMRADALQRELSDGTADSRAYREWLIHGAKENDAIIAAMVERYASPSRP